LNPIAYRGIRPLERALAKRPRLRSLLDRGSVPRPELQASHPDRRIDPHHRAVVIGFGPTGRTVVRLLRDNDIAPTVIELNMDAVRALRDEGVDAIYGDATRRETLEAAGVARAGSLILGSAGMTHSAEVIRTARALNPDLRVLARATYLRDIPPLTAAGANRVYSGEGEIALAFIEDILQHLGATAEQIDRERDRAHEELSGRSEVP
jgi:CPA2 family monovalent cation:H+ antiporter-2